MPDLLVNLLNLPPLDSAITPLETNQIIVRRAQPFELSPVRSFVIENFSRGWADEISVGFARQPVSVYIATLERKVVGFAAYECTRRGFFGPIGVSEAMRGRGVGQALVLSCLWGLREMGYVYGVIARVGPIEFYQKTVGAIVIPDSDPGIYTDLLK